ncbi:MAG: flagellar hook-length control protein FliK [Pseudomonadota bacterium]
MELLQNMSALPGQGITNLATSVPSRTVPASVDTTGLPTGTTPDSPHQDGPKGIAEFGNLLDIILGLTPAPENMGSKTSAVTDFSNIFTNPLLTVLPPAILTKALPSVISADEAASNNRQAPKSSLLSSGIPTMPAGNEEKPETAGQDIAADTKSGIIYPKTNLLPDSEVTTIVTRPSDAEAENIASTSSAPALAATSDMKINIFQAPQKNHTDAMPTSVENKTVSLTDKLLNSAAVISLPVTDNIPLNTIAPAQEPLHKQTLITAQAEDNNLYTDSKEIISSALQITADSAHAPINQSITPRQAVTNPPPIATQGASNTKTVDQNTTQKKKTEILTSTVDTVASQQPLDPQIPAESVAAPEPQLDSQHQSSTPTSPRKNTTPQHGANPVASEAATQVLPAELTAPLDMKPATGSNIPAETQQVRQQDKLPIQPLRDSNAGRSDVSSATPPVTTAVQAQIITSQPQTIVDGQGFTPALAQASEGLLAASPDRSQQFAGTDLTPRETGNIVMMDKPEALRSGAGPVLPRAETPSQHVSPPIRDIAIHIAQHTDTGANRFQLRLDPPELGRVDVRMEVSAEGKLSAVIAVERPETLDLLQRDSRALERSLMEAGLKTDSNSLSFSLKGGRQDQQHADLANNGSDRSSNPLSADWDDTVAPIAARFANRAINIHI